MAGLGRRRLDVQSELLAGNSAGQRDHSRRRDGVSPHPIMPKKLSHYDAHGRASMVDVSAKRTSKRTAEASAFVAMSKAVLKALPKNKKGDPLEVARFAGISAAKRTAELVPMCHTVPLSHVEVAALVCENGVSIATRVSTTAQTG